MNREVRIDNCKFILEWDYLGSKELVETNNHSQNDWNQTLITRINYIAANIHKNSRIGGPNINLKNIQWNLIIYFQFIK